MYADGRGSEIPIWQMATADFAELEKRAQRVIADAGADGLVVEDGNSVLGAGSAPGAEVPSPVIVVAGDADGVFSALLAGDPPVLARRDI